MELYKLRGRWRVRRPDGRKIKFDLKEDAEFYISNNYKSIDIAEEPKVIEPLEDAEPYTFEELFEEEAEKPEEETYAVSSWRKKEEAQKGWKEEEVDEIQNETSCEESS